MTPCSILKDNFMLQQTDCVWLPTTSECVDVNTYINVDYIDTKGSCQQSCRERQSCGSCLSDRSCGWCYNLNRCFDQSARSTIFQFGECSDWQSGTAA